MTTKYLHLITPHADSQGRYGRPGFSSRRMSALSTAVRSVPPHTAEIAWDVPGPRGAPSDVGEARGVWSPDEVEYSEASIREAIARHMTD